MQSRVYVEPPDTEESAVAAAFAAMEDVIQDASALDLIRQLTDTRRGLDADGRLGWVEVVPDPDPGTFDDHLLHPLGVLYHWHPRYFAGWHAARRVDGPGDVPVAGFRVPVYLLDHSIQAVRCTPYGDRWDSGLVGVYVADSVPAGSFGRPDRGRQRLLPADLTRAESKVVRQWLAADISIISALMRGAVYALQWATVDDSGILADHPDDTVYGIVDDNDDDSMVGHIENYLPDALKAAAKAAWLCRGE